MSGRTIAGWLHSGAQTVLTTLEQAAGPRTNPVPGSWSHVTKVDPEPDRPLPLLYPAYLAHTSAVSVGGSRNVTASNTEATFELLDRVPVPAVHEPSDPTHVTPKTRDAAAFLAIPEVLNGDPETLVGRLGRGIDALRTDQITPLVERTLPEWVGGELRARIEDVLTSLTLDDAVFEAYLIQNPASAAAKEAGVSAASVLDAEEARYRALAAERHLRSEVVYVEYSGTFGGEEAIEILKSVAPALNRARLWYGGGVERRDQVDALREAGADAVVVGNVFHEIAEEERRLYERAGDAVGVPSDAARDAIGAWLEDAVDVESTAAARYLATTPAETPERTARRLLAATLDLRAVLDEGSDRDARRTAADILDRHPHVAGLLGRGGTAYLADLLREPRGPRVRRSRPG